MILSTFKLCVLHFKGKTKLLSLLKAAQEAVAVPKNNQDLLTPSPFINSTISPFVLHLPSAITPFDSPSTY